MARQLGVVEVEAFGQNARFVRRRFRKGASDIWDAYLLRDGAWVYRGEVRARRGKPSSLVAGMSMLMDREASMSLVRKQRGGERSGHEEVS